MLSCEEARAIAARVPGWGREAEIEVRPLEGGLTNQSFYLEVGGEPFVLRVSGENACRLGSDREAELAALTMAARAGLAPEVVCVLRPEGHLIRRFVEGKAWEDRDLACPELMRRAVATLRQVHQLPPIEAEFSPVREIERRLRTAVELMIPLPDDTAALVRHAAGIEQQFWRRPSSDTGLCHNDPFACNFVASDRSVVLIDWEYAGMGDVYYDLACLEVDVPPTQRTALLEAYFGHVTAEAEAKLAAIGFIRELWNWTWAMLQIRFTGATPTHLALEAGLLAAARSKMPRP
jgi:thiamine kinase-like enzyme